METIRVYIAEEERGLAEAFMEVYEPYVYQGSLEENLREAKKLKNYTVTCRFCKKDRTQTTFKQDTHLISKLIGNNGYYSIDECDECNQLFKRYESDLAAYFGTSRTFNHLLNDRKAPSFESANGNIGIKKYSNEIIHLYKKKEATTDFDVNINAGEVNVVIESQLFRPEYVYRALLKMALGILPQPDIADYEMAFKILLDAENYQELNYLKKICVVETDITLARPFAQLYLKRSENIDPQFPQHLFCLNVGNLMFQLLVPGHQSDLTQIGKSFTFQFAPYIQLNIVNVHNDIIRSRTIEDLQSAAQQKRDDSIRMKFKPDNLVAFHPQTGLKDIR
jgi:hypothetical protein